MEAQQPMHAAGAPTPIVPLKLSIAHGPVVNGKATYIVSLSGAGEQWAVRRRYSDFLALHDMLTRYPAVQAAQGLFPGKHPFSRSTAPGVVEERLAKLPAWLIAICGDPQVSLDPALRSFLALDRHEGGLREAARAMTAGANGVAASAGSGEAGGHPWDDLGGAAPAAPAAALAAPAAAAPPATSAAAPKPVSPLHHHLVQEAVRVPAPVMPVLPAAAGGPPPAQAPASGALGRPTAKSGPAPVARDAVVATSGAGVVVPAVAAAAGEEGVLTATGFAEAPELHATPEVARAESTITVNLPGSDNATTNNAVAALADAQRALAEEERLLAEAAALEAAAEARRAEGNAAAAAVAAGKAETARLAAAEAAARQASARAAAEAEGLHRQYVAVKDAAAEAAEDAKALSRRAREAASAVADSHAMAQAAQEETRGLLLQARALQARAEEVRTGLMGEFTHAYEAVQAAERSVEEAGEVESHKQFAESVAAAARARAAAKQSALVKANEEAVLAAANAAAHAEAEALAMLEVARQRLTRLRSHKAALEEEALRLKSEAAASTQAAAVAASEVDAHSKGLVLVKQQAARVHALLSRLEREEAGLVQREVALEAEERALLAREAALEAGLGGEGQEADASAGPPAALLRSSRQDAFVARSGDSTTSRVYAGSAPEAASSSESWPGLTVASVEALRGNVVPPSPPGMATGLPSGEAKAGRGKPAAQHSTGGSAAARRV